MIDTHFDKSNNFLSIEAEEHATRTHIKKNTWEEFLNSFCIHPVKFAL